jgi:predicted transcriptional regulator
MLINYSKTASIYDLVRQILNSHERTAIVVDDQMKLMGVVTEGDILRALWSGIGMESPIDQCINFNPITVTELREKENLEIINWFVENGILIIPVIDDKKFVKGFLKTRETVAKIINEK